MQYIFRATGPVIRSFFSWNLNPVQKASIAGDLSLCDGEISYDIPDEVATFGVQLASKLFGGFPGSHVVAKPQRDLVELLQQG